LFHSGGPLVTMPACSFAKKPQASPARAIATSSGNSSAPRAAKYRSRRRQQPRYQAIVESLQPRRAISASRPDTSTDKATIGRPPFMHGQAPAGLHERDPRRYAQRSFACPALTSHYGPALRITRHCS
jgi:hypothetical protein